MLNTKFLLSHLFHCPFESVSVTMNLSPYMSSNDFIERELTVITQKSVSKNSVLSVL